MKRVYLGNLSYSLTEEALQSLCSKYGTVSSVKIITNPENGRSKGFAFVEMGTAEQANDLIAKLNNTEVEGRKMIAAIARERKSGPNNKRFSGGGKKYHSENKNQHME